MDLASAINNVITKTKSIEIIPAYLLPPEFQSQGWCFIGGVIGIVDKRLLTSYVQLCVQSLETSSAAASLLSVIATNDNTKVLNARKRLVSENVVLPSTEWHLVTLLLGSHLYKHCKSASLWHHRRWLLLNFDVHTSLSDEFALVSQAALHHPKNYYAWGHLRWWCEWAGIAKNNETREQLCALVRELCAKNLSDCSIWSFLHWLDSEELERFAVETDRAFPGHEAILAARRKKPALT